MRALVVDDNPEFAEMLKLALGEFGDVDIAENGTEGFKAFCSALKGDEPYALVCLDVNMPMRDGYETIQSIRLMEQKLLLNGSLGVKILIVTAFPDGYNAKRAFGVGAEAVVGKSKGLEYLVEKVRELGLVF